MIQREEITLDREVLDPEGRKAAIDYVNYESATARIKYPDGSTLWYHFDKLSWKKYHDPPPATPPPILEPEPDPHKDLGEVSSLGIPMNLPIDQFVGRSTEAHYRKKILDPIIQEVRALRKKAMMRAEHVQHTQYDCHDDNLKYNSRQDAFQQVLDLIDPPQVPATPDSDQAEG